MTDLAKRSARLLSLSLLVAAAILAACHKSETPPEAGTPAASPAASTSATSPAAAPAAPTAPLKVVALTFGKSVGADQKVTAEADTFAPSDTIYAVVGTTGGSPAARLTARWSWVSRSGAEKPVGNETKTISPTTDASTEFHLTKIDGLAIGDYKLEILLDGTSVATKAIRVAR
ncbi:MAG TPA: hypothetical protein VHB47_19845 [Thermoanaerobaculia bacterium]|jgi:hypothetical protein|nr:hypothetical protein [Thermoanaerobaculia bacterium]